MTICDIIILYIMSCSNDINPETLVKKYKKKHFTEINVNNTIQDMLFTKYNGDRENPTFFTNVLDHEENEFIIQSKINNHFYYKTRVYNKDKTVKSHTNKLKNGYC